MTRDELIEKLKTTGHGTDQIIFQKWEQIDGYGNSDFVEDWVDEVAASPNRIVLS